MKKQAIDDDVVAVMRTHEETIVCWPRPNERKTGSDPPPACHEHGKR